MVRTQKLTAEALLGAPRRSAGVPDSSGTLALYTLSTHDFGAGTTLKELKVMALQTGQVRTIAVGDEVKEAVWVPGRCEVIVLKALNGGIMQVVIMDGRVHDGGYAEGYVAGEFGAPVRAMKVRESGDGSIALVVAGLVGREGNLFNDKDEGSKLRSTGRIFDTANVRVWTELRKEQRYSLWYTRLEWRHGHGGRWRLATTMHNLISVETLEAPASMYDGEPRDMYDVGSRGIVFMAKDLCKTKPHESLLTTPFYVALDSFALPPRGPPREIGRAGGAAGRSGLGANIRIAVGDGSTVAFLYADERNFQDVRLYTGSLETMAARDVTSVLERANGGHDDGGRYVLDGFEFVGERDAMILKRQRHGRDELALWRRSIDAPEEVLWSKGSVAGFHALRGQGRDGHGDALLVSTHSFIDSSAWFVVRGGGLDGSGGHHGNGNDNGNGGNGDEDEDMSIEATCVSSLTRNGRMFGLHGDMVDEFWFQGTDGLRVHSWMIKPSDFDEGRAYPWVLMPHGGPVSAWQDAWSTRWNAAAWAEQGYVIICPNVSGSTGYGLDFMERVKGQWGGNPFQDLLHLLDQLKQLPYLDQSKAVLAGASYGGYLVSWFLGDPIIKKFCCAIWHDGVFSLPSFTLQSDIIMQSNEYGTSPYPWLSHAQMHRWDPSRPERVLNWSRAPPTLVIASERDFRCPITEGLAAFAALQAQGVRSRFLTFKDEGHWVLREENARVWHRTVWGWMGDCVAGRMAGCRGVTGMGVGITE